MKPQRKDRKDRFLVCEWGYMTKSLTRNTWDLLTVYLANFRMNLQDRGRLK